MTYNPLVQPVSISSQTAAGTNTISGNYNPTYCHQQSSDGYTYAYDTLKMVTENNLSNTSIISRRR